MPFVSTAYFNTLSEKKQNEFLSSHTILGAHAETKEEFALPHDGRYMGTYVLGVQGSGKSTLLERLIDDDISANHSVIVIDPHGDLINHCISQLHPVHFRRISVLDMEDADYPFGINIFGKLENLSRIDQQQAVDRVMHVFEVLWPEVMSQQYLPLYVRAATTALIASPGRTLLDMQPFLTNKKLRRELLKNVTDPTVIDFMRDYDDLSEENQQRRTQALTNRLTALFMGRPLVRNIVGQRQDTIDFRKAIENREIIFIKLPLNKLPYDSQVIGTILVAQISNAVFSFVDRPANKRPGVSIYVDEFQHFTTPDFAKLFTEGRKFGCRLTIAHQERSAQFPDYLRSATSTAYTKICFRLTASDAREMATYYYTNYAEVRKEDIERKVIHYLLDNPSENYEVRQFTDKYLKPLQGMRRQDRRTDGRIEIEYPGLDVWRALAPAQPNPYVDDPTVFLDALLHDVMVTGRATLPIPVPVAFGFSGVGWGFYRRLLNMKPDGRQWLLSSSVGYPDNLVEVTPYGDLRWVRPPENSKEQLWHFVFLLRKTMEYLADHPVGKETVQSSSEIAHLLTQLPRGMIFVRSGDDVGEVQTSKLNKGFGTTDPRHFQELMQNLLEQTRQRYAKPRDQVELPQNNTLEKDSDREREEDQVPIQPQSRWEDIE